MENIQDAEGSPSKQSKYAESSSNDNDAAAVALAATVASPTPNDMSDNDGHVNPTLAEASNGAGNDLLAAAAAAAHNSNAADDEDDPLSNSKKTKRKDNAPASTSTTPNKKSKKDKLMQSTSKGADGDTNMDASMNITADESMLNNSQLSADNGGEPKVNQSLVGESETRNVVKVIGACEHDQPYSHDFLHCSKCKIQKAQCSIRDCPCQGNGILFMTTESETMKRTYRHQFVFDDKSVAIHMNKPKEAISRISARLKVLENRSIRKNKNVSNPDGPLSQSFVGYSSQMSSQDSSSDQIRAVVSGNDRTESNIAEIMTQLNTTGKSQNNQDSHNGDNAASIAAATAAAAVASSSFSGTPSETSSQSKGTKSYTPYYYSQPASTGTSSPPPSMVPTSSAPTTNSRRSRKNNE